MSHAKTNGHARPLSASSSKRQSSSFQGGSGPRPLQLSPEALITSNLNPNISSASPMGLEGAGGGAVGGGAVGGGGGGGGGGDSGSGQHPPAGTTANHAHPPQVTSPLTSPSPLSPTAKRQSGILSANPRRQSSISYISPRSPLQSGRRESAEVYANGNGNANGFAKSPLSSTALSFGGDRSPGGGAGLGRSNSLGGIANGNVRRSGVRPSSVLVGGGGAERSSTGSLAIGHDAMQHLKERPPVTLAEKHAELLHFIAQKESKCLDLRSQLATHEAELVQLKRKWERIVNRGFDKSNSTTSTGPSSASSSGFPYPGGGSPSPLSPSTGAGAGAGQSTYFPVLSPTTVSNAPGAGIVLEGIKESVQGVSRLIAAGLESFAGPSASVGAGATMTTTSTTVQASSSASSTSASSHGASDNTITGTTQTHSHPHPPYLGRKPQARAGGGGSGYTHEQKESQSSSSTNASSSSVSGYSGYSVSGFSSASGSSFLSAASSGASSTATSVGSPYSEFSSTASGSGSGSGGVSGSTEEGGSEFGEFEDGNANGNGKVLGDVRWKGKAVAAAGGDDVNGNADADADPNSLSDDEQVLMVHDTGATPTMSPNPAFERRRMMQEQQQQEERRRLERRSPTATRSRSPTSPHRPPPNGNESLSDVHTHPHTQPHSHTQALTQTQTQTQHKPQKPGLRDIELSKKVARDREREEREREARETFDWNEGWDEPASEVQRRDIEAARAGAGDAVGAGNAVGANASGVVPGAFDEGTAVVGGEDVQSQSRHSATPTSSTTLSTTSTTGAATPRMVGALPGMSSIPGLAVVGGMGVTAPSAQQMSSWVESVGKKWGEIRGSETFTKNQKRASLLISDVQNTIVSALISPTPLSAAGSTTPASSTLGSQSPSVRSASPGASSFSSFSHSHSRSMLSPTSSMTAASKSSTSLLDDSDDENDRTMGFGMGMGMMAKPVLKPDAVVTPSTKGVSSFSAVSSASGHASVSSGSVSSGFGSAGAGLTSPSNSATSTATGTSAVKAPLGVKRRSGGVGKEKSAVPLTDEDEWNW